MIGMNRMPSMTRAPLVSTSRGNKNTNSAPTTNRREVMTKQSENKQQQQQQPRSQYNVEFNAMLRIRPLHKSKEREDHVVLEKAAIQHKQGDVVVLHPTMQHLTSPGAASTRSSFGSPNFIHDGQEQEFHFHKILDTSASQESVFYGMGLSMASQAMETLKKKNAGAEVKSAVVIAMGVADSGKTHTIFGKQKSGSDSEGLIPRMLDSLFSQSKHHVSSSNKTSFGVRMTLLQVDKHDVVRDLLVEPQSSKQSTPSKMSGVRAMVASFERPDGSGGKSEGDGGVSIEQDPLTNDFVVDAKSQVCRTAVQAREMLQQGLQRTNTSRLASFGKSSNRGHVVITLQPVLLNRSGEVDRFGGTICMVDLASKEKGKKSRGGQNKDSISSDSTLAALMHCFRTIKHNKNIREGRASTLDIMCDDDISIDGSEISCVSEPKQHRPSIKPVPWRQSKVAMLLQPLFSATAPRVGDKNRRYSSAEDGTTRVTLLMNAYPGHRDYVEKRSMLNDLEVLEGHEIGKTMLKRAQTGLDIQTIKEKSRYDDVDIALSYSTSEDTSDDNRSYKENHTPVKHKQVVKVCKPSVPFESPELPPMPPPMAPSHNYTKESPPSIVPPVILNDFPGVTLPASSSSIGRQSFESPPSVNPSYQAAAPKNLSSVHTKNEFPSPDFIRNRAEEATEPSHAPAAVSIATERSAPTLARVTSKPNIQPPPGNATKKSGWMASSQVKTFTAAAVNAGKKQGKRALVKIDQLTRVPGVEAEQVNNDAGSHDSAAVKIMSNSRNPAPIDLFAEPTKTKTNRGHTEPVKNKIKNRSTEPGKNKPRNRSPEKVQSKGSSQTTETVKKNKISNRTSELERIQANNRNEGAQMPSVCEVEGVYAQDALQRKIEELQLQNMTLVDRNVALECKCEALEIDKARLENQVKEKGRLGRQQQWSQQDEVQWRHSRNMRLKDQELIRSPLQEHLHHVEETYQNNHTWLKSGKQPFGLEFPKRWKGAKELDQRDKVAPQLQVLQKDPKAPAEVIIPTQRPQLQRNVSGEKRKEKGLPAIDLDQYKRLKKY